MGWVTYLEASFAHGELGSEEAYLGAVPLSRQSKNWQRAEQFHTEVQTGHNHEDVDRPWPIDGPEICATGASMQYHTKQNHCNLETWSLI